jgi:hypothetical protein
VRNLKTAWALLFLFSAMQLAGCAALLLGGAVGAGSVVYVKGQLKEDMGASVRRVHDASASALKELGLPIVEDSHDRLSASMKSRTADGSDVWITVESVTQDSSRITVRVGIIGDERKSRQILDAIHRNLR